MMLSEFSYRSSFFTDTAATINQSAFGNQAWVGLLMLSDASISLFQFRFDIDTIFTKYRDIDIDIIKYVSKMHAFLQT